MRASHDLARVSVRFDEPNLVPCAGLLPAAVLAQRVGLAGLMQRQVTLQRHGANSDTKALTVIGSMLAGGDSIDDTALRDDGEGVRRSVRRRLAVPVERGEGSHRPGTWSVRARSGHTRFISTSSMCRPPPGRSWPHPVGWTISFLGSRESAPDPSAGGEVGR